MMAVWAEDRPVFCIHPGGTLLAGREEVAESWSRIFQARTPFHFELDYYHREEFEHVAISHLSETLYLQNHVVGVVLVTNTYCATDLGWRMIMHHASPQPELEDSSSETPILH